MIVTIPSTPQRFYVTFSTQANSDIRLGECLRTFRKINLLLRQEHSLIFPPHLWMGYLTKDWAHVCELWCVQSLLQHLLLDASFLKNIFDLHWFSEQMTFSKENKKQKQFPLKINENAVFKNQKTVSIENPTKWICFFRAFSYDFQEHLAENRELLPGYSRCKKDATLFLRSRSRFSGAPT